MNQSAAHSALVAEILALCGSRPDCRLWQNSTGFARGLTHDGVIKFGLKGSADIIGIGSQAGGYSKVPSGLGLFELRHNLSGVFLAIEVKTGSAVQSKQQKAFQVMIQNFGGYYFVARSAEDANKWLDGVLG